MRKIRWSTSDHRSRHADDDESNCIDVFAPRGDKDARHRHEMSVQGHVSFDEQLGNAQIHSIDDTFEFRRVDSIGIRDETNDRTVDEKMDILEQNDIPWAVASDRFVRKFPMDKNMECVIRDLGLTLNALNTHSTARSNGICYSQ